MITGMNGQPIDVPRKIVFADGSDVPQNSPASPTAGKVTLVVPPGAGYCVFKTADASASVADMNDQSKGYYPVTANSDFRYPCPTVSRIYITSASAVSFFFELL